MRWNGCEMVPQCVQVIVPGFQARYGHRAAAFSIAPALTLVTIFGGDTSSTVYAYCANTTVLELGESTCMCFSLRSQAVGEGTLELPAYLYAAIAVIGVLEYLSQNTLSPEQRLNRSALLCMLGPAIYNYST